MKRSVLRLNEYSSQWLRRGSFGERVYVELCLRDHYSPRLLFFLILIIGLNYLDACFTMMILEKGGRELNPIVESALRIWGDKFWIWKFSMVSVSSVILCLFSQYKRVKIAIVVVSFLYLVLVSYQLIGLNIHNFQ
ncbi:MAG: hypothetical protein HY787_03725 [Deltaproteobacteria bacterium]|nr:hypothetical protein [Deltaproteobacteria bacterium]